MLAYRLVKFDKQLSFLSVLLFISSVYIPCVTLLLCFDNFISFSQPSPLVLLPSTLFPKFLFNPSCSSREMLLFPQDSAGLCSVLYALKESLNRFSVVSVVEPQDAYSAPKRGENRNGWNFSSLLKKFSLHITLTQFCPNLSTTASSTFTYFQCYLLIRNTGPSKADSVQCDQKPELYNKIYSLSNSEI